jgi:hypothetical protein
MDHQSSRDVSARPSEIAPNSCRAEREHPTSPAFSCASSKPRKSLYSFMELKPQLLRSISAWPTARFRGVMPLVHVAVPFGLPV